MERDIKKEPGTDTQVVPGGQTDNETKQQIHTLAQASAVAHDTVVEQIDLVRQQQVEIATKTSEYLQEKYDQQLDLQRQQEGVRKHMEEHRYHLQERFRLLNAAEEDMFRQERQLEDLTEAVRPHIEARWGLFAEQSESAPAMDQGARQTEEPSVMLTTGVNMPVPPLYRGRTKNVKRDFIDSHMVYNRLVDMLSQCTQTRVFMMPLGVWIEQSTLIRFCCFELDNWNAYFLEARKPDVTAYKTLRLAVKPLALNVMLHDILDDLNMEDLIHEDPKSVVEYLTNALRPQVFKATIKDYLSWPTYKPVKRNVRVFLKWLKPQRDEFMKYEAHIQATMTTQSNAPKAPVGLHGGGLSKAVVSANKPVSGMGKLASTSSLQPPSMNDSRRQT
ncbi:hypothetical protein PHMEG_000522 [Phytophthora megakarya]|uniref:Uncharacterized protein n=1 Tax=Phytophthora megakarya TaxID=4795 RepID=A0A225X5C8_9STRA|nr:hypothetical protein PHMEG_000522 [Phytophthora megakarya]